MKPMMTTLVMITVMIVRLSFFHSQPNFVLFLKASTQRWPQASQAMSAEHSFGSAYKVLMLAELEWNCSRT